MTDNNWVELPLSNGGVTLVDLADLELAKPHTWHRHKSKEGLFYARANVNGKKVYLHRFLMQAARGELVDHKNEDGLDNRRSTNLRKATKSQNGANRTRKPKNYSSRFKGVTRHDNKWLAQITVNYKHRYLGIFETEEAAAEAYRKAAQESFGGFHKC